MKELARKGPTRRDKEMRTRAKGKELRVEGTERSESFLKINSTRGRRSSKSRNFCRAAATKDRVRIEWKESEGWEEGNESRTGLNPTPTSTYPLSLSHRSLPESNPNEEVRVSVVPFSERPLRAHTEGTTAFMLPDSIQRAMSSYEKDG